MASLTLTAVMEIREGNPFVFITQEQAARVKPRWRKPMPVLIKVNGQPSQPWHINMMPTGTGDFYLYLHGDVRKASDTKVGDTVTIEITFDKEYKNGPQHPMPTWFIQALEKNKVAQENWQKLIPSRQKEILRYFAGLKSKEAQQRNLEKALAVLSGESARFMARSWKEGK